MFVHMSPMMVDLAGWPGVVLRVSAEGTVAASNGRLDARLGTDVVGRPVAELLDRESSLGGWSSLTSGAGAATGGWELIFRAGERVLEPGAYTLVALGGGDGWWLVEQPAQRGLATIASEVALVNAELTAAQRSLVVERARLTRALAELERSNRALDDFAQIVSHDLKAPLRAIRDYAELLADTEVASTEEERASYLRRIRDLTARMRRMIDAVLQYARAGRTEERVEPVDTGAMLRDVVAFLAPPPCVTIRIAPEMPTIETERVPLEQVLRNLLSNAIAYRREGESHIDISTADAGEYAEIIVADDGPGIADSERDRIWRLFHTSRPGEGTGLGLALVKRIVDSYHGGITVRSAPGEGAAFHLRWPRRPARALTPLGADDGVAR